MSTQVSEVSPAASAGRRRASGRAARLPVPRFDSWYGVVWALVIGLDFFWLSNPHVLLDFEVSLRIACITTVVGLVVTIGRLRAPRPAESVLAVLALGFASALWSINPSQTFTFTLDYALMAAIATVIVRNADARTIVHGMMLGGLIFLGASIYAMARDMPGALGPYYADTRFAGVGGNRNIFSYTMVVAFAFGVSVIPRTWRGRLLWAPAIGGLLVGLYLAKSTTGLVTTGLVATVAVALLISDRRRLASARVDRRRRWLVWVACSVGIVAALVGGEMVGRLLGRDTGTLSGRLPLWEAIWSTTTGVDRWFGSGWGAVWWHGWVHAPPNPVVDDIVEHTGYWLSHGHNSIFDLIPELGLVGVAVFATTYAQAIARAFKQRAYVASTTTGHLQASRAAILVIIALILVGVTEPMSTIPLGWFTIVMLASGLAVPRARRPVTRRGRRRRTDSSAGHRPPPDVATQA